MIRFHIILLPLCLPTVSAPSVSADCSEPRTSSPAPSPAFSTAATSTSIFRLRPASGEYLAGRAKGAHAGVDVTATSITEHRDDFRVHASGGGQIAFVGNSDPKGYGFTVIVDHQNGEYSLYAHLAEGASKGCVKLGDWVGEGDVIGYVFDPTTREMSSGNAAATKGVNKWEHVQLHVEIILAPKNRTSATNVSEIKKGAEITDPTPRLVKNGYDKAK